MIWFGESYIVFLPGDTIIFRFLDDHDDFDITPLLKAVEHIKSSCAESQISFLMKCEIGINDNLNYKYLEK